MGYFNPQFLKLPYFKKIWVSLHCLRQEIKDKEVKNNWGIVAKKLAGKKGKIKQIAEVMTDKWASFTLTWLYDAYGSPLQPFFDMEAKLVREDFEPMVLELNPKVPSQGTVPLYPFMGCQYIYESWPAETKPEETEEYKQCITKVVDCLDKSTCEEDKSTEHEQHVEMAHKLIHFFMTTRNTKKQVLDRWTMEDLIVLFVKMEEKLEVYIEKRDENRRPYYDTELPHEFCTMTDVRRNICYFRKKMLKWARDLEETEPVNNFNLLVKISQNCEDMTDTIDELIEMYIEKAIPGYDKASKMTVASKIQVAKRSTFLIPQAVSRDQIKRKSHKDISQAMSKTLTARHDPSSTSTLYSQRKGSSISTVRVKYSAQEPSSLHRATDSITWGLSTICSSTRGASARPNSESKGTSVGREMVSAGKRASTVPRKESKAGRDGSTNRARTSLANAGRMSIIHRAGKKIWEKPHIAPEISDEKLSVEGFYNNMERMGPDPGVIDPYYIDSSDPETSGNEVNKPDRNKDELNKDAFDKVANGITQPQIAWKDTKPLNHPQNTLLEKVARLSTGYQSILDYPKIKHPSPWNASTKCEDTMTEYTVTGKPNKSKKRNELSEESVTKTLETDDGTLRNDGEILGNDGKILGNDGEILRNDQEILGNNDKIHGNDGETLENDSKTLGNAAVAQWKSPLGTNCTFRTRLLSAGQRSSSRPMTQTTFLQTVVKKQPLKCSRKNHLMKPKPRWRI